MTVADRVAFFSEKDTNHLKERNRGKRPGWAQLTSATISADLDVRQMSVFGRAAIVAGYPSYRRHRADHDDR
jgi:hypothetical protein